MIEEYFSINCANPLYSLKSAAGFLCVRKIDMGQTIGRFIPDNLSCPSDTKICILPPPEPDDEFSHPCGQRSYVMIKVFLSFTCMINRRLYIVYTHQTYLQYKRDTENTKLSCAEFAKSRS